MPKLMPFDELNTLKEELTNGTSLHTADGKMDKDKVIDSVLDLLIMSYVYGTNDVSESLGEEISPTYEEMQSSIYHKVDNKDFADRISEYANSNDVPSIVRVAETEIHRVYNESAYGTAIKGGATTKTWNTMLDNKVRDEHWWLEGETIPTDAEFYCDGATAMYPGGFGVPELDINCRCYLTYNK